MSKKAVSGMLLVLLLIWALLLTSVSQKINAETATQETNFAEFDDLSYHGLEDLFSSLNVSGTVVLWDDYNLNSSANHINYTDTSVADLGNYSRPEGGNWSKAARSLEVDGTVTLYENPNFTGRAATFTSSSLSYENIGTEWNANTNLTETDDKWDNRTWNWGPNLLEIDNSSNNYVRWNNDGSVESQAQCDVSGDPWRASNFDQGYERYEDEIYNLSDYELYSTVGGPVTWNHQASSLRVEGSVTVYDGIGYTGNSRTLVSDYPDLRAIDWNEKISSLKLGNGSGVTLYQFGNYGGISTSFVHPSYQPPDLKVSDMETITLEGVVCNWSTDYNRQLGARGWTGAKFDIFAVENRSGNGKVLMLEMYFLRSGLNLAWPVRLNPITEWTQKGIIDTPQWFRPPLLGGSTYNYLVALDYCPEYAQRTVYPRNIVKWTIDLKSLIDNACNDFDLDITKLSIAKVSFTLEASNDFFRVANDTATVDCTLNSLRLVYTPAPTHAFSSFYYFDNKPRVNETVTFDATSSYVPGGNYTGYAWDFGDGNTTTTTLPIIDHTYASPGNYTVTLNASTDYGVWNTTSHQVLVTFKTDVNRDGNVDLQDLVIIAVAYGSRAGDPNWNANADVNGDGKVDLMDLAMLAMDYGKTV